MGRARGGLQSPRSQHLLSGSYGADVLRVLAPGSPDLLVLSGLLVFSHLLLPRHVTDVHWTLGQLSHHEDGGNTLPLCVGHDGKVGRPCLKMLGAERILRECVEPVILHAHQSSSGSSQL